MLKKILCGATLLCAASLSNAATITQNFNVMLADTNFDLTIPFNLFDDMGGTRILDSVSFSIAGGIEGNARAESLDAGPATLELTLSATLTLTDALMNTLVVTIPTVVNSFDAAAFDGEINFAGPSGVSFDGITASATNSETYTDAPTLAIFTGVGSMDFGFDATATSTATGAGNIISQFQSQAGGEVEVIYEWSAVPVSAPSQVAFLGLGLLAFAGLRKARK